MENFWSGTRFFKLLNYFKKPLSENAALDNWYMNFNKQKVNAQLANNY